MSSDKIYNTQCLKVKELRTKGYKHLEEWIDNSNNIYVGRSGRIFIHENGNKRIYHYKKSKWANPFKVEDCKSIEECLNKYLQYLKENNLLQYLDELKGKTLGCFCDQKGLCHAKLLYDLIS